MTSTLLVILMAIPGLALFYGGMARSKNVLSLSMQVFVTFSLISVLWCIYGYSVAFTGGNAGAPDQRRGLQLAGSRRLSAQRHFHLPPPLR